MQSEVARYTDYLATVKHNTKGEVSDSSVFTFHLGSSTLAVSGMEKLDIRIAGSSVDANVPTINVADLTGAVVEGGAVSPSGAITDTGTITFYDVNYANTHTAVATPIAGSNPLGGTATWSYSVADAATQFLAAGQTIDEPFNVTIADNTGKLATRTITVTGNVYNVTVTVSDGSLTDTQSLTVNVTNINDAPTITSNGGAATAAVSIAENTTAVTTVVAVDADNPSLAYSIAGGVDAAKFSINATSGALSFVSAPDFEAPTDANLDRVYNVIVQASDGALFDTQALAVTVTNVAESRLVSYVAVPVGFASSPLSHAIALHMQPSDAFLHPFVTLDSVPANVLVGRNGSPPIIGNPYSYDEVATWTLTPTSTNSGISTINYTVHTDTGDNPFSITFNEYTGNFAQGTAGNDVLVEGNSGVMTGGAGSDVLVLYDINSTSTITDFNPAEGDVLDLHNLLSSFAGYDGTNATSAGYLIFAASNPETSQGIDIYVGTNGGNNPTHLIGQILDVDVAAFLLSPMYL